jgi:hypothetical protein
VRGVGEVQLSVTIRRHLCCIQAPARRLLTHACQPLLEAQNIPLLLQPHLVRLFMQTVLSAALARPMELVVSGGWGGMSPGHRAPALTAMTANGAQ